MLNSLLLQIHSNLPSGLWFNYQNNNLIYSSFPCRHITREFVVFGNLNWFTSNPSGRYWLRLLQFSSCPLFVQNWTTNEPWILTEKNCNCTILGNKVIRFYAILFWIHLKAFKNVTLMQQFSSVWIEVGTNKAKHESQALWLSVDQNYRMTHILDFWVKLCNSI